MDKVEAEINYFQSLPEVLKPYHPRFLGKSTQGLWPVGYGLEKIPVFDAGLYHTSQVWDPKDYYTTLFQSLEEFWTRASRRARPEGHWPWIEKHVVTRDLARLEEMERLGLIPEVDSLIQHQGFASTESFLSDLHLAMNSQSGGPTQTFFSHGDLCLSNILLHEGHLYLVDPRGLYPQDDGHRLAEYDLAKLSQCVLGHYDYINQGLDWQNAVVNPEAAAPLSKLITNLNARPALVRLIESAHFISMIPLHAKGPYKTSAFVVKATEAFHAGTRS